MPYPHTVADEEAHDHDCGAKALVALGGPDEKPGRKPMRYVSLHHHSTYSFLDGYALPEAHVRRAEEIGMQALAMTEHGNIASHTKLDTATAGTGIKPLFGVELYCGTIADGKTQRRKNHLTVIAEDQDGYRNLLRLVTRSWQQMARRGRRSNFYRNPHTSAFGSPTIKTGGTGYASRRGGFSYSTTQIRGGKINRSIGGHIGNRTKSIALTKRNVGRGALIGAGGLAVGGAALVARKHRKKPLSAAQRNQRKQAARAPRRRRARRG